MIKTYKSPGYNYIFDCSNGFFARWGDTEDENPEYSLAGPEILDLEISTICHQGCEWCYKSNTHVGKNMTLSTFESILDKMPPTLTQIAFGIGDIGANKDLYAMMEYARIKNIVPNITINGSRMKSDDYTRLSQLCGAVAVSCYNTKTCFNAVEKLTNKGMKQVNIHKLLSRETWQECMNLLDATKTEKKLEKLNAIVFLCLKPKGSRNSFHKVSQKHFRMLVEKALELKVRFGFDSCAAPNFLNAVRNHPNYKQLEVVSESCESGCFSSYVNVDGVYFPCSFAEGIVPGINVLVAKDFVKDVWNHPETLEFRNKLIGNKDTNGCRNCTIYDLRCE